MSIDKKDTLRIDLYISENSFYGKYTSNRAGGYIVEGDVDGEVRGDTLIGTLYYTPYKWKNKKRKAFALLKNGEIFYEGKGIEYIYIYGNPVL